VFSKTLWLWKMSTDKRKGCYYRLFFLDLETGKRYRFRSVATGERNELKRRNGFPLDKRIDIWTFL
jgi:hypothetical protein